MPPLAAYTTSFEKVNCPALSDSSLWDRASLPNNRVQAGKSLEPLPQAALPAVPQKRHDGPPVFKIIHSIKGYR